MISKIILRQFPDLEEDDLAIVNKAYLCASKAHHGQKRKSGEPYISHPVAVAKTLSEWKMDPACLAAAILHDVIEDSAVTREEISKDFGEEIAFLVDGVTKLGELELGSTTAASSAENLRKLLLAMSRDLRVILIKLADRLHNLKTLQYLKPEDQLRIAQESLDVYAPIADRLGMGRLKAQIEDIAFRYANEKQYHALKKLVAPLIHSRVRKLDEVKLQLEHELAKERIDNTIESRVKHLYSTYKKLNKFDGKLEEIRDLVAIRIIVDDIEQCYRVLGIVHRHYKPMVNLIKDYIAVPKPNGYQSLHTTVLGENGTIFEIQIRTKIMHQEAESGLAAHYYYNQAKSNKSYLRNQSVTVPNKLNWVKNLLDWQENLSGSDELKNALKLDLFNNRIFVFSPKGDLFDLPENSTPVDFAFALHSDIGLRTKGAKVNNHIVSLNKPLNSRDVVEILLAKSKVGPSRDWLNFVKTAKARSNIKSWFKNIDRDTNLAIGLQLIEEKTSQRAINKAALQKNPQLEQVVNKFGLNSFEALCVAVGEGSVSAERVADLLASQTQRRAPIIKKLFKQEDVYFPRISDNGDIETTLAADCCEPVYPQPIVGFTTRSSGVLIHRLNCAVVKSSPQRQLPARWSAELSGSNLKLEIFSESRVGLLSDITAEVAKRNLFISDIVKRKRKNNHSLLRLNIKNSSPGDEVSLVKALAAVPAVKSVRRRK